MGIGTHQCILLVAPFLLHTSNVIMVADRGNVSLVLVRILSMLVKWLGGSTNEITTHS